MQPGHLDDIVDGKWLGAALSEDAKIVVRQLDSARNLTAPSIDAVDALVLLVIRDRLGEHLVDDGSLHYLRVRTIL